MTSIKEDLDAYFDLPAKIHKQFGYQEQWRVFPLQDCRYYYWFLNDCEEVLYHEEREAVQHETGEHYSASVYTYRHLDQYIYRTDDYTMILADTHCDGNVFMMIFDNSKEIK